MRLEAVRLHAAAGADRPPGRRRLAAIDIGSNSIHMIVVAPEAGGGYRILGREREMVRLGRSALGKGALSRGAMDRGVDALVKVTTLARLKGADRAVAVATSAVREAANGREFLARVKAQTGLDVTLLSGEEEGRLIHRAVTEVVDLSAGTSLVIDVGGGSTEWIVGRDGEPACVESLPLGSLRCSLDLAGDPPEAGDVERLRERIREVLADLPAAARFEGAPGRVVATSGTAVTCAALLDHLAAREGRPAPAGSLREVRVKELRQVIDLLAGRTRDEIAALPAVGGRPRAQSILAGAVLLAELLAVAGADSFSVTDRALRDGLVLAALGLEPGAAAPEEDNRRRQVLRLARRAESVYEHCVEAARLVTRLFDLTPSIHGLGERERQWLEFAALLHDVGYSINYRGHHKHSHYLITNAGLDAFDPAEVEIVALVARYHRGKRPRRGRADLAALPRWQRRTIEKLVAILRLGDALDRTHARRVQEVYCSITPGRVDLEVLSPWDVRLELEAARDGAALFERVFGVEVTLRQGLKEAT